MQNSKGFNLASYFHIQFPFSCVGVFDSYAQYNTSEAIHHNGLRCYILSPLCGELVRYTLSMANTFLLPAVHLTTLI